VIRALFDREECPALLKSEIRTGISSRILRHSRPATCCVTEVRIDYREDSRASSRLLKFLVTSVRLIFHHSQHDRFARDSVRSRVPPQHVSFDSRLITHAGATATHPMVGHVHGGIPARVERVVTAEYVPRLA